MLEAYMYLGYSMEAAKYFSDFVYFEPSSLNTSPFYNRPLTQCYQEVARSVFLSTGDKKRKSHSEVQDKVSVLWANAKLFDKGIKLFTGKKYC